MNSNICNRMVPKIGVTALTRVAIVKNQRFGITIDWSCRAFKFLFVENNLD